MHRGHVSFQFVSLGEGGIARHAPKRLWLVRIIGRPGVIAADEVVEANVSVQLVHMDGAEVAVHAVDLVGVRQVLQVEQKL